MRSKIFIKIFFSLMPCSCLTSCYFGANESGSKIMKDFYLVGWDDRDWIAYSSEDVDIYATEKIIIGHDVFAVGNNEDFIIVKQHPCENKDLHFMDFDSLKPNISITNYFIIDTRNDGYKLHQFDNEKDFNTAKTQFGIPKSLTYKFNDNKIE